MKGFWLAGRALILASCCVFLGACSARVPEHALPPGILGDLPQVAAVQSRSISPENFTGGKGAAAMATQGTSQSAARALGQGWKVSPSVIIKAHSTFTLADIHSSGCIAHIWMTPTGNWRREILRAYWDGEAEPSIESPVGDFFAAGLGSAAPVSSLVVCVNPGSAFNCYWPMPFRTAAKITLENRDDRDMVLYYQIDYSLGQVPAAAAYLHAQFRSESPLKTTGLYTLLDGVRGSGQYVGTYMVYHSLHSGWWGEGEMKFFIDGDGRFPTICSTGTEDYFCGSYSFEDRITHRYAPFSTPYAGLVQITPTDKTNAADQKFGLYRWHLTDPIRF